MSTRFFAENGGNPLHPAELSWNHLAGIRIQTIERQLLPKPAGKQTRYAERRRWDNTERSPDNVTNSDQGNSR